MSNAEMHRLCRCEGNRLGIVRQPHYLLWLLLGLQSRMIQHGPDPRRVDTGDLIRKQISG